MPGWLDVCLMLALVVLARSSEEAGAQIWGRNNGPASAAMYSALPGLLPDPVHAGTVYAWNGSALHRSTNAGLSWESPTSTGLSTYGSMVVNPLDGALYTAPVSGIWKSTDRGDSWTQVGSATKGALGIDPSTGTLYAGDPAASLAAHLWRSTDGGSSWTAVQALGFFQGVADIAILFRFDPQTPGVGYAATVFKSIWKTIDGGTTWTRVADVGGLHQFGSPSALEIDAANRNVLYVTIDTNVFRSKNGGTKWTKLRAPYPGAPVMVAGDPFRGGVLYAAVDYHGVYRSDDGGSRWTPASTGLTSLHFTALAFDPTQAGRAYAATESYVDLQATGVYVQLCGNGDDDPEEECDDGNLVGGDGCSAECRQERNLTKDEQKCVNGMNAKGTALTKLQLSENLGCFDASARGTEADPQACLTTDAKHRISMARTKLASAEPGLCAVAPPYGYTSATSVGDAAVEEAAALVNDIFGPSLTAAQVTPDENASAADCQRQVLVGAQRVYTAYVNAFVACKKKRLKGILWPKAGSAADVADCLDTFSSSFGKAGQKLSDARYGACFNLDTAALFPNGNASPLLHVYNQVLCRVCRTFNQMDGLTRECDVFDLDADGSCPP